ncbi:MAG: tRNA pseudouridine(55) synthase TruB [Campylobacterota bacterium]|nr:tRNA pseudouridine(55) synthase TruB [Campylobacterota bacterium]
MNKLFVAHKPRGLSSNQYLTRLKRKFKVKKAGYSGTLDPFADGCLIVAFGTHTRLFRFLNKTPKSYRATLWLGAYSQTLDIEAVEKISNVHEFPLHVIDASISSLHGVQTYKPPIYCAKKINGQKAYELARRGEDVELKEITSTIHNIKLINYCHPFVTFEAVVSEGTFIRSLGTIIAQKLGVDGSLSSLTRLSEGQFSYNNEISLDIKKSLNIEQNRYLNELHVIELGQKLTIDDFEKKDDGVYWLDCGNTITIVEIESGSVKYLLNKVVVC